MENGSAGNRTADVSGDGGSLQCGDSENADEGSVRGGESASGTVQCDFDGVSNDEESKESEADYNTSGGRSDILKGYICSQWNKGDQNRKSVEGNKDEECGTDENQSERGSVSTESAEQDHSQRDSCHQTDNSDCNGDVSNRDSSSDSGTNIVKEYVCSQWNKATHKEDTKQNNDEEECGTDEYQSKRDSASTECDEQNHSQRDSRHQTESNKVSDCNGDASEQDSSPESGIDILKEYVCSQWNKSTNKRDTTRPNNGEDCGPDEYQTKRDSVSTERDDQNHSQKESRHQTENNRISDCNGDTSNHNSSHESGIDTLKEYVCSRFNQTTQKRETAHENKEECGTDENQSTSDSTSTECDHSRESTRDSSSTVCDHSQESTRDSSFTVRDHSQESTRDSTSTECDHSQEDFQHQTDRNGTSDRADSVPESGIDILKEYICSHFNQKAQQRDTEDDPCATDKDHSKRGSLSSECDEQNHSRRDSENCGTSRSNESSARNSESGINILKAYVCSHINQINRRRATARSNQDRDADDRSDRGSLATECDDQTGHSGSPHTEEGASSYKNSASNEANVNADLYSFCNGDAESRRATAPQDDEASDADLYETLSQKSAGRRGDHGDEIYSSESVESVASESWTQSGLDDYDRMSREQNQNKSNFVPCVLNLNFGSAATDRESARYSGKHQNPKISISGNLDLCTKNGHLFQMQAR